MSVVVAGARRELAAVRHYRLTAPNAADTPRLARNHVAELMTCAGLGQLVDTARLLVSEAVTNVYQHTAVPHVTVRTTLHPGRVVVAVVDTAVAGISIVVRRQVPSFFGEPSPTPGASGPASGPASAAGPARPGGTTQTDPPVGAAGCGQEDAEHGRGLALVAALSAAWGISWQAGEKSVWFELGS